ncbi:methionyl-tRNA formyltransferase [Heliorestis acidaminivorans]|uniref:Methionyl-tRNA formyltransferase n=1 Tax=Heliorestis acidaminivorans TaxID=553427 RepID=A0A6I0F669_9FIRM|nr:methionyl-tRNA formyltransferase [Heliorestis acidaminivorans]KAB2954472.1 methionyl-tRNA formyltransferase [Heliorestis acidaminivorans]
MRILFMGTPDFAVPTLQALVEAGYEIPLVVSRPDRKRGRGQKTMPSPVKKVAQELSIPVLHPAKLDQDFIEILQKEKIDLGVVVAFGRILPPDLLKALPKGWINVHASLLPAYRGAAPIHRAVMAGEQETGITTMLMSEGLDEGDMLLQEKIAVHEDDTVGKVHDQLALVGASLLVKTLKKLEQGQLKPQPQNHEEATYASMLYVEDEQINWQESAEKIHNQVRGMNPWPGASMKDNGKIVKVFKGCLRKEGLALEGNGQPGEIIAITGEEVAVATGQGLYWLQEVRPAGSKTMTAGAYVRGRRIAKGYCFT